MFPLETLPVLSTLEFEKVSRLAYQYCGLDLSNGKQDLVAARLGKQLRELGLKNFKDYYDYVTSDATGAAMTHMVDLLTTNHTSFFREPSHFDLLRQTIYPALKHRSEIDIWSAACSSGEEPYSIAMTLLEESRDQVLAKVRIRATDISTRVLEKGRQAIYSADRFTDMPVATMRRYLQRGQSGASTFYRFKPEVRGMVHFEHLNLMECLPEGYRCSVLFCRNVMIYFDKPTQQELLRRLSAQLEDGGYLLIGHSESLNGITHGFEYVSPATYRKPGGLPGFRKGRG